MTVKKLSELTDEELDLAHAAAIQTEREKKLETMRANRRNDMTNYIRKVNGINLIDTDTHMAPKPGEIIKIEDGVFPTST